ncbi:hypothetical protein MTR_4g064270 [Medicago truncatula]|uniref:Uncharacterized protein n=1 Tax=Medicago truncatula TaxID=3880 RepID=G7JUU6_MEDTR|nr:hypothetical protein MTR_4g064270 [Medicago truncatula]
MDKNNERIVQSSRSGSRAGRTLLKRLGLEDCFERIIIYTRRPDSDMVLPKTSVICKSFKFKDAFDKAFKLHVLYKVDLCVNSNCHMMHVGTSMHSTRVDHALESIHNIREAFPKVAIETTVKA